MGRFRSLALAAIALAAPASATAKEGVLRQTLTIPHVHHVPTVDDFVRAQAVGGAHTAGMAMVDRLIQRAPDEGATASGRTRVYIGYDSEHVYAAFICFDANPSAVRGQLAGRERIADDDDNVALHLDTFGDRKHAYGFQVSAAGVQRDGIWTESTGAWDFAFDAIWHAESRRTALGYVVLITVPLSSLRFPPRDEQSWGLFFFREIPRKGELAYWPAYSPRVAGRLTQAAVATGIRRIAAGRNLQLTPYSTAEALQDRTGAARLSRPGAGVDAKWIVRQRYVLDATFNPDFSQVESDEPQVTVNERFEKLFPEKRPFFLENAGYFGTPIPLLFTRRIVDPHVGVRITGKQGPYAVAGLVVDDQAPSGAVGSARARLAAVRTTRNLGREGFIGAFVSTGARDGRVNRLVGVDGRFALGSSWSGVWQAVTTTTGRRGERLAAGPAYTARIARSGRSTTYAAEWHDRSAGFAADNGFVPRVDVRSLDQTATYRFRPAGRRLLAWGPDLSVAQVWDRRGMRLDRAVTPTLTFEWAGPVAISLFHTWAQERLRPSEIATVTHVLDTNADRTGVTVLFSGFRRVVWSGSVSRGAGVNLQPTDQRVPDAAQRMEAMAAVSARLARGLTVDGTFLSTRLSARVADASILANDIWRVKTTYQLTRELGVRLIVQRGVLMSNAAWTPLPRQAENTADLLVTYMAAPGRALFIGVNRHEQRRAAAAARDGWQIFAKLSYAFRL